MSRAIALATSPEAIPSHVSWGTLFSGTSDVLRWSERDSATQISARIERWSTVDGLVAECLDEGYLVGESQSFRVLLRNMVEAARFTSTPILLTGESGTGKELLARLIHKVSPRGFRKGDNPVTVDCSTIVPELLGQRVVRPRARGLHRRARLTRRCVRAGEWLHAVSRRDRRTGASAANTASARDSGEDL